MSDLVFVACGTTKRDQYLDELSNCKGPIFVKRPTKSFSNKKGRDSRFSLRRQEKRLNFGNHFPILKVETILL